jgi:hypothetical protein
MPSRAPVPIEPLTRLPSTRRSSARAQLGPVVHRVAWGTVAIALLALLSAAWGLSVEAPWVRLLMAALLVLAWGRPRDGLLAIAGLAPVIGVYGAVAGAPFSLRELLILAICAGWSLRIATVRPTGPLLPAGLGWPLFAAVAIVLSSLAVELYGMRVLAGPAGLRAMIEDTLGHGLLHHRQGIRGLNAGLVYLEGLAMFAAAAALCARGPALVGQATAMAVAGALGAALLNIQRLVVAAQASADPLERLRELVRTVRISVGYFDVNAAGSYFALMFFPAAAQLVQSTAWRRVLWTVPVAAIFAAAWLTGSRAAVAAIIAVALLTLLVVARRRAAGRAVVAAAIVCLLAAGAFLTLFPNQVFGGATPVAVQIRVEMARVSLALLADHPLFGVGVGGFFEASAPHLAGSPIAVYYRYENAHNNALQWLAELGLVGFAAFVWLLWRAVRRVADAVAGPAGTHAAGLAAGLAAFALTAMLGHPLLIAEVNHAFWLLLGIACGAAPPARPHPGRSRVAPAAAGLIVALAVGLLPWRAHDVAARLPLEHVRYGASVWETDGDGVRYQTFVGETTLFVPSTAQAVDIPLRLDSGDTPAEVEIRFRNRTADRLTITMSSWTSYRLIIGTSRDDHPYLPVIVRAVDDEARVIRIGRTVVR